MSKNRLRIEFVSVHNSTTPLRADAEKIIAGMKPDTNFKFENGSLTYKVNDQFKYTYSDLFNVDDSLGVLHYFEMACAAEPTQDDCDKFMEMLKVFKTNLYSVGSTKIETLWDDVSFRYCLLAYPVILDVENKMRRLIAKFMLSKLGAKWVDDSAPEDVSREIEKTKRNAEDPLHNVDFITLSSYLTRPYATGKKTPLDINKIIASIDTSKPEETIEKIKLLKSMVPSSNWERYFHSIVPCQDSELQSKWKKLYDLRCVVAHNAYMKATEYNEVIKLSAEIMNLLDKATDNIDNIKVTPEQAEDLSAMVADMALVTPPNFAGGGAGFQRPTLDPRSQLIIDGAAIKINYAKSTLHEIARCLGDDSIVGAPFLKSVVWARSTGILSEFQSAVLGDLWELSQGRHSNLRLDQLTVMDEASTYIIFEHLRRHRLRAKREMRRDDRESGHAPQ
ncbi:HEPN domain-containing protein [Burkholderia gladioli]|uniref:HEPN domain-containing protein n=1 Tax=Burkholderia gladioli TaxID=28095 RepID=UPI0016411D5F|nr:HEPN domain-containing protein [Burkholderia gladioli]